MTTYYISPSGSDSTGAGTLANPWKTLPKAISSSTTNDTINCLAGTYNIIDWTGQGATVTGRIIMGSGRSTTIFDFTGCDGMTYGNFKITSGVNSFSGILFQNLITTVNWYSEIFAISSSVTLNITNCGFKVLRLSAANEGVCGFIVREYGVTAAFVNFYGNLFYDCLGNALNGGWTPLFSCHTENTHTFYHNVFYFPTPSVAGRLSEVFIITGITNPKIFKNNIFINASGLLTVPKLFNATTFTVYNNCDYGFNASGKKLSDFPNQGNLSETDPLFVDLANLDFHLQAGSPCRKTGIIL